MIQILPCLANKRPPLQALLLARRFADEHQFRILRPFAKDQRILPSRHHARNQGFKRLPLLLFFHQPASVSPGYAFSSINLSRIA